MSRQFEPQLWPTLNWDAWKDTADTLHMWTQIVGKTRMTLAPFQNHWWHVPFYVSARGLTTSAMPWNREALEIEFDFVSHDLHFRISPGETLSVPLRAQSVASFYEEYKRCLALLGVEVPMSPLPCELKDPIPFDKDEVHHSYDPDYAHRFWRVLNSASCLFEQFKSRFLGKQSPVHFFWGSFDLAVTRFNGHSTQQRANADSITREAYSHDVISAGFWPGNGGFGSAAFYCYAAPAPAGLELEKVLPSGANYDTKLGEFILKYDDVRASRTPDNAVLDFLQSSYDAAAKLAKWDRAALERPAQNVANV